MKLSLNRSKLQEEYRKLFQEANLYMPQRPNWSQPVSEERDLIPGTLLGYREWYIDQDALWPIAVRNNWHWGPGWNEAGCARNSPYNSNHTGGDIPARNCGCGFYGTYRYESQFHWPQYTSGEATIHVIAGVIEAKGRVTLHQSGFRAEKARVKALFPVAGLYEENFAQAVKNATNYYQVPFLSSYQEAGEEFSFVDPVTLGILPMMSTLEQAAYRASAIGINKASSIYFNTGTL